MATPLSAPALVLGQLALAAGAFAAVLLAPPAKGRMTIVSLAGESGDRIAAWAARAPIGIVAIGRHSLTVEGSRGDIAALALRHAGLVLAPIGEGCAP
jgi:hypothetical protein